jgi:azurin
MGQVTRVRSMDAGRCLLPIAAAGVFLLCALATATGQGPEVKVIEIEIGDNMRYTPSVIDAGPGQKLRVVLRPVGKIKALGHNFVLLKPGTEAKPFVDKAAAATEQTGDIPPAVRDQVIAEIPLVRSGNTGEVTFEAPVQRGEYDFVCTFPSHFKLGMKGRLLVK